MSIETNIIASGGETTVSRIMIERKHAILTSIGAQATVLRSYTIDNCTQYDEIPGCEERWGDDKGSKKNE